MKTLTVNIFDESGEVFAWVRMSAERRFEEVMPEAVGGPGVHSLDLMAKLMPDLPADIEAIAGMTGGIAHDAGLDFRREWTGQYQMEYVHPEDSDDEK